MSIELSKSQKKIARELIENSLQMECTQFLEEIEMSVSNWKLKHKSSHEAYLNLYKKVKSFDKHIVKRYDDLRESTYFTILMGLLLDEILVPEDLDCFDEELKGRLLNAIKS